MEMQVICKFIEEQCLVKIDSMDEKLFSSGKLPSGFFMYLIMEIEERCSVVFEDDELKLEDFDTVRLIASMLDRAKEIPRGMPNMM